MNYRREIEILQTLASDWREEEDLVAAMAAWLVRRANAKAAIAQCVNDGRLESKEGKVRWVKGQELKQLLGAAPDVEVFDEEACEIVADILRDRGYHATVEGRGRGDYRPEEYVVVIRKREVDR